MNRRTRRHSTRRSSAVRPLSDNQARLSSASSHHDPSSGDIAAEIFPELRAGGYSRNDQQVVFHTRVRAVLSDVSAHSDIRPFVVDLGAGRGAFLEQETGFKRSVMDLRDVSTVLAVDVDADVAENDACHFKARADGTNLPFAESSVDLVYARSVLEHVEDPGRFVNEITRVVRPGGWFAALTPNKFGIVALGARTVPNTLHSAALRRLQPERPDRDIFPTTYRMNRISTLHKMFPETHWSNASYYFGELPRYFGNSVPLARLLRTYERLTPASLSSHIHVFAQRRRDPNSRRAIPAPNATRANGAS